MEWFYYALIAAFALALNSVLSRLVLREKKVGAIAEAALSQLAGALFFLPIFLSDVSLPSDLAPWIIVAVSAVVWTAVNVAFALAAKHAEASVMGPIANSSILFVFIISALLLSEQVTLFRSLGVLLIFAGSIALTWRKGAVFSGFKSFGVQMAVLAAFLAALGSLIDKVAMSYLTVSTYGFLEFLITGLMLSCILLVKGQSFGKLNGFRRWIALAALLNVVSYFASLSAYKLVDISVVYPVMRMSTLLVVLMGALFLNEKGNVLNRALGALAMIAGAILLV